MEVEFCLLVDRLSCGRNCILHSRPVVLKSLLPRQLERSLAYLEMICFERYCGATVFFNSNQKSGVSFYQKRCTSAMWDDFSKMSRLPPFRSSTGDIVALKDQWHGTRIEPEESLRE
eukprot:CCRYP_012422-RA/>CCRYP_012422-RA protein AED:0.46 eAED:0.53 QI:0/0/0.5/1/0/0/2/906/116